MTVSGFWRFFCQQNFSCGRGCLTLYDGIFFTAHKRNFRPHHTRRIYLFKYAGSNRLKILWSPAHAVAANTDHTATITVTLTLICPHGYYTVLRNYGVTNFASYLGGSRFRLWLFLILVIPCRQTRNNTWNWLHPVKLTCGSQPTFRLYVLYVILAHAMQAYGGQSTVNLLINLSTRWGGWSPARFGRLAVRKRSQLISHVEPRTRMELLL